MICECNGGGNAGGGNATTLSDRYSRFTSDEGLSADASPATHNRAYRQGWGEGRARDHRWGRVEGPGRRGWWTAQEGADPARGAPDERLRAATPEGVQQWQQAGQLAVGFGVGRARARWRPGAGSRSGPGHASPAGRGGARPAMAVPTSDMAALAASRTAWPAPGWPSASGWEASRRSGATARWPPGGRARDRAEQAGGGQLVDLDPGISESAVSGPRAHSACRNGSTPTRSSDSSMPRPCPRLAEIRTRSPVRRW